MTERYRCARCSAEVAEGTEHFRSLRPTVSPNVMFGPCDTCETRRREAQSAKMKPLPKAGPVAFRRVT